MRIAIPIVLSDAQRATLMRWARSRAVATWRQRFAVQRPAGIQYERAGRGRKAYKRKQCGRTIVEVALHAKLKNATHWSTRTLAEHLGG